MAEDSKCKVTPQITKLAFQIVYKLSSLQDKINKHAGEDRAEHIKEISTMMRYLLSHFNSNPSIPMELKTEEDIDYLILAAENEIGIGYYGTLPDNRSFNFIVLNSNLNNTYRILILFSFSKWIDHGMELILKKAFKDRKWVAERPLQKDADIMLFIEEI